MPYKVILTKYAYKDLAKIKLSGYLAKAMVIFEILENDPFQNPPTYEKLVGDLDELYSCRLNIRHRVIYKVDKEQKLVTVLRMLTHYESLHENQEEYE